MESCAIPGESAFMPRIARDIAHHYPTLKKINKGSVPFSSLFFTEHIEITGFRLSPE
jgi:hypothetical protein